MHNLASDRAYEDRLRHMLASLWRRVRDSKDRALWNSHYAGLRPAPFGPVSPKTDLVGLPSSASNCAEDLARCTA